MYSIVTRLMLQENIAKKNNLTEERRRVLSYPFYILIHAIIHSLNVDIRNCTLPTTLPVVYRTACIQSNGLHESSRGKYRPIQKTLGSDSEYLKKINQLLLLDIKLI